MKIYKNLALSMFAIVLALLCVCALPQTAQAASASDLTFTLNETGDGYIVSDCVWGITGKLTIPATYNGLPVTSIGDSAFSGCYGLTSVTIPDSVTTIGYDAFRGCDSLTSMNVEEGNTVYHSAGNCIIETASKTLIAGCQTSQIPADGSVTIIGGHAFRGCDSLTSITIPDSVTSIGNGAFLECYFLTRVTIGNGVATIGSYAFNDCNKVTSITMGNSVTTIGDDAFWNCDSLDSVTYCGTREQWDAIEIGEGNQDLTGATLQKHNYNSGFCALCKNDVDATSIVTFTLNETGDGYIVSRCEKNAAGKLIIPATYNGLPVTTIGSAFFDCYRLTSVTIPDSVTTIGGLAFYCCSKLTSITIPDSVTSIGDYAFSGCRSLTSVTYCGTQEQWDAIEIASSNEYLSEATLRLHDVADGFCTICGVAAVTLSVPEGDIHRGDEVAVTVSVPAIDKCTTGGFLFSFDTNIFEYVRGEALVRGYGAAGISQINGNVAGYFMNGEENIQGDIFRIILRVKDNAPFADYTISGEASFSVQGSSEKVPNVVFGTTATVTCDHSYWGWIHIDETWKKRTCTICSHEERDYIDYTVTFQYADGTVISAVTYHYGDTVTAPQDPTQLNSVFVGWDREIVACTGDAVYTAVFEVYVPGDMNGDENLTYNDAVYLLLHAMYGEERYPLSNAPADIDGNGFADENDAVYLLLHVFYGEENYPLKKD